MNVPAKPSLINALAQRYDLEPAKFYETIRQTVMPGQATEAQTMAFLMVAKKYDLDPILKQIFAFPSKGGGITPIISVDGWCELVNRHEHYDGVQFKDHFNDEGSIYAITATMFRKDRGHPTVVTEYLDECARNTDAWKTSPKRMLRHRAFIQAARLSLGLSAAFDEGHHIEVEVDGETVDVDMTKLQQQVAPPRPKPPSPKNGIVANMETSAKATGSPTGQQPPPPQQDAKPEAKDPPAELHDPETGELFDPEAYLTDLDGSLVTAQNEQDLTAIWSDFDVQTNLGAHATYYERAKDLLAWHRKRLRKG